MAENKLAVLQHGHWGRFGPMWLESFAKHVESTAHDKESPIEQPQECFAHNSTTTWPIPTIWPPFDSENWPQQFYGEKVMHFELVHSCQLLSYSVMLFHNLLGILALSMQYTAMKSSFGVGLWVQSVSAEVNGLGSPYWWVNQWLCSSSLCEWAPCSSTTLPLFLWTYIILYILPSHNSIHVVQVHTPWANPSSSLSNIALQVQWV